MDVYRWSKVKMNWVRNILLHFILTLYKESLSKFQDSFFFYFKKNNLKSESLKTTTKSLKSSQHSKNNINDDNFNFVSSSDVYLHVHVYLMMRRLMGY
jgi:hypothetical protein